MKKYIRSTQRKHVQTKQSSEPNSQPTLNSFIAKAGIASRRKAVELISKGFVTVNRRTEKNSAYRVQETDEVAYKGAPVRPEKKLYVLLNKPKGYITTVSDEKDRKTVIDLVGLQDVARLYPVGRLDRATTGLLLLTNDGDLSLKLAHPRNKVEKVYLVAVDKKVPFKDIQTLREGIKLSDGFIKPDHVDYSDDSGKSIIIALHSGKNRIVRRIFEHFEHTVKKLDRIQYAQLTKKGLQQGQWRFLTEQEVAQLKSSRPRTEKSITN